MTSLSLLTVLLDCAIFYIVWRLTGSIFDGQIAGRAVAMAFHYFAARSRFFKPQPKFLTLLIAGMPITYLGIRIVTAVTHVRVPTAKLVFEGLLLLAAIAIAKPSQAATPGPVRGGGVWAWVLWPLLLIPAAVEAFGFRSTELLTQFVWDPVGQHRFVLFALVCSGVSVAFGFVARRYFRTAVLTAVLACSVYAVGTAPVGTVLLYVFSCTVLGRLVFGEDTEGPLAFLAGTAIWIAGMYLTLYMPVHYAGTHLAAMALPVLAGYRQTKRLAMEWLRLLLPTERTPSLTTFWAFALLAFLVVANWLVVLKPEISTDGLAMHLAIPADIARHHFFSIDFHQFIWALMPMGGDLGFAAVYASGGEYAARLLNFAMLCGVALLLFRTARSFVPESVAALLAALFVSTPMVYLATGSLFVENSVAFTVLGAVVAVWRFHETRAMRYLLLAATLLGTAMALKLGALTAGLIGFAILIIDFWRGRTKRSPALALAVCAIVLVTGSFPYAKAWKLTGNPFFPFQTGPFKSALVDDDIRDVRYNQPLNWRTPYQLTFETGHYYEGQAGSFGFQYFLFLPLMLAGLVAVRSFRSWSVIAISLISAVIIAATQSNARYFYFLMPLLTLGIAPVLGWLRERQGRFFQTALVAAVIACFGNIWFLPSADWYNRDFYASPLFTEKGRQLYVHVGGPIREVIQFVNGVDQTEPVVLVDSSQIAGVLAPVHAVQWHDYAFLKHVAALQRPVEVFRFFRQEKVAQLIIEKNREDRPETVMRMLKACGEPEFTAKTWEAVKLRPDCERVLAVARGRVDDIDPRIALLKDWVRETKFPETFGSTIAYTNVPGASVQVTIDGTGFRYMYTKAFNRGIAAVIVDGRQVAVIDLYGKEIEWQAHTDFTGLGPGLHEIEIRVTRNKSAAATDYNIDIDALEVF